MYRCRQGGDEAKDKGAAAQKVSIRKCALSRSEVS